MAKLSTVLIAFTLVALCLPVFPASAGPSMEVNTWLRVNIPAENTTGGWVLASGSDVQHLTLARDGTLYSYANPAGTSYRLFKSSDNGTTWAPAGSVTDSIVDIAVARDDPQFVYYATPSTVYRSSDAANTFVALPANPGGAGSGNIEITSIDATITSQRNRIIAVGTRDTDAGQYGGVYTLDENMPFVWTNTTAGNYDVYAVAISPTYAIDREMIAVVTDETDTFVTVKVGDSGWGSVIASARLNPDGSAIPIAVSRSASISFPDDYETVPLVQRVQFVAIDTGSGTGDVYRINSAAAPGRSLTTDLNVGMTYGVANVDVTSVAVSGSGTSPILLAGAASSTQVYFSPDGGRNWTRATKEPSGRTGTEVVIPPGFASQGKAYAATRGTESAFSCTVDRGNTWNQLSLVDTRLTDIVDLAISPNYSRDNTMFLLTHRFGGSDSLWRTVSGGNRWERVYSSPTGVSITRVALSPQYGATGRVVFMAGDGGAPAVLQSTDNGQTFARRVTRKPATGGAFPVDAWAMVDNNSLFIGSHEGGSGLVYSTTSAGAWYNSEAAAGSYPMNSVALSPNYAQDRTVLAGNTAGWVYYSNDDGKSFQPLPPDAASPPLSGDVCVAFDPKYKDNRTVYATSSTASKGVYRYVIGKSADWERIDGNLPAGGKLGQMALSADGVLYAANAKADGGMERSLDPTYPLTVSFETVTKGLTPGAILNKLWIHGTTLWSVDTANSRVVTYLDNLTQPIKPTSPEKASTVGNINNYAAINVVLDWHSAEGATSYRWNLNYSGDFSTLPTGFDATTESTSVRLPPLDPATKYYWRVRAEAPVPGPWSPTGYFTTVSGTEALAPGAMSPGSGASSIETRPAFQWSPVPQGQRYELVVSTDGAFANTVVAKTGERALPATAWQCDTGLNPGTTYYWRVRAVGSGGYSPWSTVSTFTTKPPATTPAPVPTPASLAPTPTAPQVIVMTPAPVPQITVDTPEWVKLVVGGLMLIVVLQLVVILVLVMTMRRS